MELQRRKKEEAKKMDIDLTQLDANAIIRILREYDDGRLVIKDKRVFWSCSGIKALSGNDYPEFLQKRGVPKKITAGDRFKKMSDTLGSLMGP